MNVEMAEFSRIYPGCHGSPVHPVPPPPFRGWFEPPSSEANGDSIRAPTVYEDAKWIARSILLLDKPRVDKAMALISLLPPLFAARSVQMERMLLGGARFYVHGSERHLGISIVDDAGQILSAHRDENWVHINVGLRLNEARRIVFKGNMAERIVYEGYLQNGYATRQYLMEVLSYQPKRGSYICGPPPGMFLPGRNDCASWVAKIINKGGGDSLHGTVPTKGLEFESWLRQHGKL